MVYIHSSAFVSNDIPLDNDNVVEELEKCAKELEQLAQDYRKMATTIVEKKIHILNTMGSAHCGSIEVDEIDAGRLKQYGLIQDYTDAKPNQDDTMATFFIDPNFDKAISIASEMSDNFDLGGPEPWSAPWATDSDMDPNMYTEHPDISELSDKLLEEMRNNPNPFAFSLPMNPSDSSGVLEVGAMFNSLNMGEGNIHIDVDDMGMPLKNVKFSRADKLFKWTDPATGANNTASLKQINDSLGMATALISQLAYSAYKSKEVVGLALRSIEDNLRLVKHLVELDYLPE